MAKIARQGELFPTPTPPKGTVVINDRCLIRTQDGHRLVIVSGIVLSQYAMNDHMAEAYAMVTLFEQGWAEQIDVARAFGCSVRTMRRHQRRYDDGGLPALGHGRGYPPGRPRLPTSRKNLVYRLKTEGHSNREIARRIGISEMAVRKLLRRLGWKRPGPEQKLLPIDIDQGANPNLSASSASHPGEPLKETPVDANPNLSAFPSEGEEPVPFSLDTDPANRVFDRALAHVGLLADAAPMFRPGINVPGAGVLLALPAIVHA